MLNNTGRVRHNHRHDQLCSDDADSEPRAPPSPNDHEFVIFSSQYSAAAAPVASRDDTQEEDGTKERISGTRNQQVSTPRKILKAKNMFGPFSQGENTLPEIETLATPVARKLQKMGKNSLFNFGFKSMNMDKTSPIIPTTLTAHNCDVKTCNVHSNPLDCDCNVFPTCHKLPSELLDIEHIDVSADTTDNNSHTLTHT